MKTAIVYALAATKDRAEETCTVGSFQRNEEDAQRTLEDLRRKFPGDFDNYRVFALKISAEALP